MPSAVPRSFGGKVAVMMESVAGSMNAAPTPWTTRAAMRNPAPVASPQARDESVKTSRPTTKIRRRPNMSASLPPVSMSTAKEST